MKIAGPDIFVRTCFFQKMPYVVKSDVIYKKTAKMELKKCIKKSLKFCEVCAHFFMDSCYNIHRKNPPIHYIVFATPHKKKYLLQKKAALSAVFFSAQKSE